MCYAIFNSHEQKVCLNICFEEGEEKEEFLQVEIPAIHTRDSMLDALEILSEAILKIREEQNCDSSSHKRALAHVRQSTRIHIVENTDKK